MRNIFIFVGLFCLFSCTEKGKESVFNGEITIMDDIKDTMYFHGNKIELDDIHAGYMSVYDSLILFITHQYPEYILSVFSLNSGKLLGRFCRKGPGPEDFRDFYHSEQYVIKDNAIKLWGYDSRKKIYLLNLTESIINNKTIIDTLLIQNWEQLNTRPWMFSFLLTSDLLLIRNAPDYYSINNENRNFGSYRFYEKTIDNEIKRINLFNRLPKGKENTNIDDYYYSLDRMRSLNDKIVLGMGYLCQINILDIESGELKGYRIKDTPDFDDLPEAKFYYTDTCVDDTFIFCLYIGKTLKENPSLSNNIIHVYDWNGIFIKKIELDYTVNQITFDPVGKYLYGYTNDEEIIQYDFNILY